MKRKIAILFVAVVMTLPLAAHEYFPMEVGFWWDFSGVEVDSLGLPIPGTEYTTNTTITGTAEIGGIDYYILTDSSDQEGSWELVESSYMRAVGDTVKVLMTLFDDSLIWQELDIAILPRPEGFNWTILHYDTTYEEMGNTIHMVLYWSGEVMDFGTIVVPAGLFPNTYHIRHTMEFEMEFSLPETSFAYTMSQEIWAAQDVGPVRWFQLPTSGPGDLQPGGLEQLEDFSTPVESTKPQAVPGVFALQPVYPNPFNPSTTLTFSLPYNSRVDFSLYDLAGNLVRGWTAGELAAGVHRSTVEARGLASGIYWLKMQAGSFSVSQKIVLLK